MKNAPNFRVPFYLALCIKISVGSQKRHEDKYSCLLLWNTEILAKPDEGPYADGMGPYLVVTSPLLGRTFTFLSARLNDYPFNRALFILCIGILLWMACPHQFCQAFYLCVSSCHAKTSCRSFYSTTGGLFFLLSVIRGTVRLKHSPYSFCRPCMLFDE